MDITEEALLERIKELVEERDNYVQQANSQVAAYNGAIQALRDLLNPPKEEEDA